ncbi:EthD family reductase [Aquabacterium sp.]|uniref:EthD family reductase n=1 Tax=Aquabacterium sp. TaxID=1872578 RepID=UPI002C54E115|nr:EthD family reductase [Aquabacterium sp.]HSW06701.1 EthD family reductase [Aquabacterium sp.]
MSTNMVVLASRPPDWTQERFTTWWRGEHAAMAMKLPGLLAYRHGVVVFDYDHPEAAAWDGNAVLGFADRQALDAAIASPEWAAAVAHAGRMKGRRLVLITEEVDLLAAAAASGR